MQQGFTRGGEESLVWYWHLVSPGAVVRLIGRYLAGLDLTLWFSLLGSAPGLVLGLFSLFFFLDVCLVFSVTLFNSIHISVTHTLQSLLIFDYPHLFPSLSLMLSQFVTTATEKMNPLSRLALSHYWEVDWQADKQDGCETVSGMSRTLRWGCGRCPGRGVVVICDITKGQLSQLDKVQDWKKWMTIC